MADAQKTPPLGKPPAPKTEPKVLQKLGLRTLFAVVAIGGLFIGLRSFLDYNRDPGSYGTVETPDMIAAIEFQRDGQQAVAIKPDGTILKSPGFQPGQTERDLAWQPDGGRIYYISDREKGTFQVFRWRPVDGGESEARSIGTRGKSNPSFAPDATGKDDVLISSMGTIQELDPVTQKTRQILPPMANDLPQGTSDEEGGGGSSIFAALYGELGDSFARAQLLPGGKQIVALMRGNRGDVLVLQTLTPGSNGKMPRPNPLAAGDRIEFSVAKDGTFVFSVQNFSFPTDDLARSYRQGNKVAVPYRHGVFRFAEGEGLAILAISQDDTKAYGQPSVSPDGTRVLFVEGPYDGTNMEVKGLFIKSLKNALPEDLLVNGPVADPTWHPRGEKIAYVKRDGGNRAIFLANADGTDEKNLTGTKGDFSRPLFSPWLPK